MRQIILASKSPRRKQLLKQIGLDFVAVESGVEEKLNPRLKPKQQAAQLSRQKAYAVAKRFPHSLIIAADTLVALGDEVIVKPKSENEARVLLKKLSGKMHCVHTGFTIIDTITGKKVTKSLMTKIWFRKLGRLEIDAYVLIEKPYDKAGAYGVQGLAAVFVEKIEGDFFSVVGLPLYSLALELKKFGVRIL